MFIGTSSKYGPMSMGRSHLLGIRFRIGEGASSLIRQNILLPRNAGELIGSPGYVPGANVSDNHILSKADLFFQPALPHGPPPAHRLYNYGPVSRCRTPALSPPKKIAPCLYKVLFKIKKIKTISCFLY